PSASGGRSRPGSRSRGRPRPASRGSRSAWRRTPGTGDGGPRRPPARSHRAREGPVSAPARRSARSCSSGPFLAWQNARGAYPSRNRPATKHVAPGMAHSVAIPARLPSVAHSATMARMAAIQPTDEELLARVADGDRDAFGDLYQRYARAVLGLAIRRLGDRGRAEDAVQAAFASVGGAARRYRPGRGPVAAWLYAVARNAIA